MTNQNSNGNQNDIVVGIDLGTTNSLIAVYDDHKVNIIEIDNSPLLPSYVGASPSNELLVGHPARNQYILYPDKTVKSIKRRMGGTERIQLGDRALLPEEISALILNHLKVSAEKALGITIQRAVITVPAYFNDTQRQATRAAGEIAGLEVVRIVNEPTAASLAFRHSVLSSQKEGQELSAVYDLGGGTFDVSIVREEGELTEVLASRGDTRLGGDDFDQLILDSFLSRIQTEYRVDLRENVQAMNRLMHAAEAAKIELSAHSYTHVIEEELAEHNGTPIHLDYELTREDYEEMIRSLIDRTINCIQQALHDAELSTSDIDNVLLVGGSTRTPFVRTLLENHFQQKPRSELHPDHCVVMGAAILGARLQGQDVDNILIDITPHSFGINAIARDEFGFPVPYCFARIISRNTPLPVTQSEVFSTTMDNQESVKIEVYQGENEDVRDNTHIGEFWVEGLSRAPAGNKVIGRMSLDLNGILTVTAVEKKTGLQKSIKIENAYKPKDPEDIANSRAQLSDWISTDEENVIPHEGEKPLQPSAASALPPEHQDLLNRTRSTLNQMHPDDRQEAEELCQQIEQRFAQQQEYDEQLNELRELLYFVGA